MYWFGKNLPVETDLTEHSLWEGMDDRSVRFARTPIQSILEVLDGFGRTWVEGSEVFELALQELEASSGFGSADTRKTLALLPQLLSRESLEQRLRAELGNIEILDGFIKTPNFLGKTRAFPRGLTLHVTAGNVFLGAIDSLVMGLLTKNLSLVKVATSNQMFPILFANALRDFDTKKVISESFAVLSWRGGNERVEPFLKRKVRTILAWGGEEMLSSYCRELPPSVKLLDFGPKVSLQLITQKGIAGKSLREVAQNIVADIIPWDQSACSSPQNLFLEEGILEGPFLEELQIAFDEAPSRGPVSADEATEIQKERFRATYSSLMEGGAIREGRDFLLHLDRSRYLRPSPLNRTLIIKKFQDLRDLQEQLLPFSFYLQSCAYLLGKDEKSSYLEELSLAGVRRFGPLGTITMGMEGAPHDGRLVLRELLNFIGDEARAQTLTTDSPLSGSSELQQFFAAAEHPPGYVFSSGGTTGAPKYVHFSYEEFDYVTDMLALNFRAQGLGPGTMVANLFVAGNLWSSFMAVEKALQKVGAVQLPIGGLCAKESIIGYLTRFKPSVLVGIPSLLADLAEECQRRGVHIEVERVFYAGEALSQSRIEYLSAVWKTKYFGSAGYASVDAGVIGYQCEESSTGEHHLFSDLVSLQIIEGEAVVTSELRTSMPIRNYRTGDRVEWLPPCPCGRKDPRFKLLGRIDEVILIWSCRVLATDLEDSLREQTPEIRAFQIILSLELEDGVPREKLELLYAGPVEASGGLLKRRTFERCQDLRDTIEFEVFSKNVAVKRVEGHEIFVNPRTGKTPRIIDRRR